MAELTRAFASDNWAGAHPEVLAAVAAANAGHAPAYGDDPWTARATERFRELLGDVEVFFTFNGTGANVTALRACMQPWGACICPETAHIATDECGASERFTGSPLRTVPTPDGKLTPALVAPLLKGFGVLHHSQPQVISITQATEFGTVYTAEETGALAEQAHEHGMRLHVDGARIANAAAALDLPLRTITGDAGVDVLSFGGAKNGLLLGEAVVFFDRTLAHDFAYIRKQSGQLASKMRFVAAQFEALLTDELWLRSARHANGMAARLADGLRDLGVTLTQEPQANEIFAILPPETVEPLSAVCPFHLWDASRSEVRLVTSFDTTDSDVDGFLTELRRLLGR